MIVASILRLALLFNDNLGDSTCKTSRSCDSPSILTVNADVLEKAFMWSNIEVDVAVLCANLPLLRPVYQYMWSSLRTIMYDRTVGKGLGRSDSSDRTFALPNMMDRSARKEFQSLDDGNGYSETSITAQGDLKQGEERYDGIHVKREVQNNFENI